MSKNVLQQREVDLAADERRGVGAGQIRPEPRPRSQRLEDAHRLRLAFHRGRIELLIVEHHRRGLVRGDADGDSHLRRETLQPRRGVDRIAGQEAFARPRVHVEPHQRLARVDAHPQAKRRTSQSLQPLRRLHDPEARADRSFRVVLVRGGHAEHAHHRVTDELLDDAAVVLDRGSHHLRVGVEHRVHVLGIRRLRQAREPDQVAEQGRDDLALLRHRPFGNRQRKAALGAELRALGTGAALPTDDHQPSLRPSFTPSGQRETPEQQKSRCGSSAPPASALGMCVVHFLDLPSFAGYLRHIRRPAGSGPVAASEQGVGHTTAAAGSASERRRKDGCV